MSDSSRIRIRNFEYQICNPDAAHYCLDPQHCLICTFYDIITLNETPTERKEKNVLYILDLDGPVHLVKPLARSLEGGVALFEDDRKAFDRHIDVASWLLGLDRPRGWSGTSDTKSRSSSQFSGLYLLQMPENVKQIKNKKLKSTVIFFLNSKIMSCFFSLRKVQVKLKILQFL